MTTTSPAAPLHGRDLPEQPLGTTLTLDCPTCGRQFQWLSEEGMQRPMTYCSKSCRNRGHRAVARATRFALDALDPAAAAAGQLRLLLCVRCEAMFGWLPMQAEHGDHPPLYCSPTCSAAMHLRRRKARAEAAFALRAQRRADHEANEAAAQQRKADKAARAGRIAEANELRAALEARRRAVAGWAHPPATPVAEDVAHEAQVAALAAAARELLLPATHCPACNKVASPTKEAAKAAKRGIEQRTGRTNEVRFYECPSGFWHWTSQV